VGASVYAETILRPMPAGTDATVDAFFDAAGVKFVAVDRAIARRAARLRADHSSCGSPMRCRSPPHSVPTRRY
jgi:hypothetical protein